MKKQFMTLVACATMAGSIMPAYADNSAKRLSPQGVKMHAVVKNIADLLTIPLVGAQVAWLIYYKVLPHTQLPFLPDAVMTVIDGGASVGVGLLAGIAASEATMGLYKLFGFTDAEIAAIRDESWAQKLWILGQAATIGWAAAAVHAAQQEEKERKEREKHSTHIIVL